MKNNTNYFSHDCNAREDEKILQLRAKYGWEGYGIWRLIVEKLSEAKDYKLLLSNKVVISTLYIANMEVIDYLFDIGLLKNEGDYFFSPSLSHRMSLKNSAKEKMSKGGTEAMKKRRGNHKVSEKKLSDSSPKAQENKVLITSKVKQSKVKEKKVKEDNTIVLASPEFGDQSINIILEKIKMYNGGIIDGTQTDQRKYGKLLLNKLEKLDSVASGKYTAPDILEIILKIISKSDYHSQKIAGPKKIYYELAGLMQICKQDMQKQEKNKIPFIPGV